MYARHELLCVRKLVLLLLLLTLLGTGSGLRYPSRKTWWTKAITDDLHVTGQLSRKQIKLANDAGVKSIISLFTIPAQSPPNPDAAPSTQEASALAVSIGLTFNVILNTAPASTTGWATLQTLNSLNTVLNSSPKPVILYGKDGYVAVFLGLVHNLIKTSTEQTVIQDVIEMFERGRVLGYNYVEDMKLKELVLTAVGLTSTQFTSYLGPPSLTLLNWYTSSTLWKLKPVGGNLWVSGQIESTELPTLKAAGFTVVVNLRRGASRNGRPTQEEAVLLNIKDRTGTYDDQRNPRRQLRSTLEESRLNRSQFNTYISPTSMYNYESINPLQFGDEIGYNETLERMAFEGSGLEYYHNPVGDEYNYGLTLWEAYRDRLMRLGRTKTAILLQCRTGFRSSVISMVMYGCLHGLNSTQVLQLTNRMGYPFVTYPSSSSIKQFLRTVLDNREANCGSPSAPMPTPAPTPAPTPSSGPILTGQLLSIITVFTAYIVMYQHD